MALRACLRTKPGLTGRFGSFGGESPSLCVSISSKHTELLLPTVRCRNWSKGRSACLFVSVCATPLTHNTGAESEYEAERVKKRVFVMCCMPAVSFSCLSQRLRKQKLMRNCSLAKEKNVFVHHFNLDLFKLLTRLHIDTYYIKFYNKYATWLFPVFWMCVLLLCDRWLWTEPVCCVPVQVFCPSSPAAVMLLLAGLLRLLLSGAAAPPHRRSKWILTRAQVSILLIRLCRWKDAFQMRHEVQL